VARYVCKCGGKNPLCDICHGNRYYTPKKEDTEVYRPYKGPEPSDTPTEEVETDAKP